MRRFQIISIVISLIVFTSFIADLPTPFAEEKTLVFGVEYGTDHFDPQQAGEERTILANMYEGLTKQKPGSYEIGPGLAERWDISPDGKVYTFYLRKGVKFHDGSDFTSEAVKINYDRQMNRESPFYKMGKFPYGRARFGNIDKIEIIDDYTVKMYMKRPMAPFLHYLSMYAAWMVSPSALKKWGKEYPRHPAGTGPFFPELEGWEPGGNVVFKKFPDYWGKKPGIDRLIFAVFPDPEARVSALQAGTVDLIWGVHPDTIPLLEKDPNLKLVRQEESPRIWYVLLNNRVKPFNDVRVRQAMNYAVNKKEIIKHVLRNTGVVAKSPLSPAFKPYYDESLPGYPYDPEKAKKLLKEAGYPDGFSVTFKVPEAGRTLQLPVDMAVVIQSQLKKIGIEAKIEIYQWSTYVSQVLNKGDYQMSVRYWASIIGDPDNVFWHQFHSSRITPGQYNFANYVNPIVDYLIEGGRFTIDEKKRREYYKLADWIISAEAPWIFVDHEIVIAAMNKKVHGFLIHPSANYMADTVYFK